MENHFVYIIYSSANDIFYKGYTTDVEQRILYHNKNKSRYTANKGPWKLVFTKQFVSKKDALIEEKRLKKLNRRSIEKLISEY